jgi:hypothetical protein
MRSRFAIRNARELRLLKWIILLPVCLFLVMLRPRWMPREYAWVLAAAAFLFAALPAGMLAKEIVVVSLLCWVIGLLSRWLGKWVVFWVIGVPFSRLCPAGTLQWSRPASRI